jgi:hypothetical protein
MKPLCYQFATPAKYLMIVGIRMVQPDEVEDFVEGVIILCHITKEICFERGDLHQPL